MPHMEEHPDRLKWNQKHHTHPIPDRPSETVTRYASLASKGRALDIACGLGRHSKYLASEGFEVDAVDISDYALSTLDAISGIHAFHVDLHTYQIPRDSYNLICNVYFNERRLIPYIKEGLKVGGVVIFESFVEDSRFHLQSFSNRDHYLRPNEILHAFIGLRILYYEERDICRYDGQSARIASLVAQKT